MVLVAYSDSEDSEDQNVSLTNAASNPDLKPSPHTRKRKRAGYKEDEARTRDKPSKTLPPLPNTFRNLYATNTRASIQDDPKLHGGRKRQMPHVEGNWPTHIYLEWYPSPTELTILSKLVSGFAQERSVDASEQTVHSLLHTDLGVQAPLHVSLSRTLALAGPERHAFLIALKTALENTSIRPFNAMISGINWVPNFERNRWFLVLQLRQPDNNELDKLLSACNKTASAFRQSQLYDDTTRKAGTKSALSKQDVADHSNRFHISIAWSLKEHQVTSLNEGAVTEDPNIESFTLQFDSVKVKIGNVIETIPLAVQKDAGIGGL